jgi:hypothetical protein
MPGYYSWKPKKKLRQDNSSVWVVLGTELCNSLVDDVLSLLNVWSGMNGRCNKPSQRGYELYGGKGKKLCKEWTGRQGQIKFVKWAISRGWKHGLVIDRINGRFGYSPHNCRVVTQQENSRNKSNNVMLTYAGETKCCAEWGDDPRCVVPNNQFQQRIKCGWNIERALSTPLRRCKRS